jgi:cyanophycinase-like exopeptidase
MPRILAIMGSGETAPTLSRVHRSLLERLGPSPVPAVLIDTPYGFQENADDISGRTMDFFRETVGHPIGVASFRSAAIDQLTRATAVARIREARYVFTGPGSPSYALRQWTDSEIPGLLAEKLATGGVLTFASAAALTLGILTVPVYEIYKVGEAPHWLAGLDLLSAAAGLRVAVIPHYDNAEGGNHDTRFCYLGERRLEAMERDLPDDVFVLGVDGHTALVLDLEAGTAAVLGLGGVTIRARGRSTVFPTGSSVPIDALRDAAGGGPAAGTVRAGTVRAEPTGTPRPRDATEPSALAQGETLTATVARLERSFESGIADRDVEAAVRVVLDLDRTVIEWSRDTGLAAEFDHARSVLRSLIVRLGELAVDGTRDPRSVVAPFVDTLVQVRLHARESRDWATADAIRDRLVGAGVEIHDTPDGTDWELRQDAASVG